tara:strand:- start:6846 stop:7586 length:741 start_codon:yes stop_codon:yes gene_type:complete
MGIATAAAVASVAVGVGSVVSQRSQAKKQESAAKKAAAGQEGAAIESAQFLQQQGIEGERLVREAAMEAAETAGQIPEQAIQPLQRTADLGRSAFNKSSADILGGQPNSQAALSRIIGDTAMGGSMGVPTGQGVSDPVQAELLRQAGFTGELAGRQFSGGLADMGRMGVLAAGDIANIESRGAARMGDLATQQASGRASSLVGAATPAANMIQGAGEARLLSDFAGNRLKTQNAEQLAQLAGKYLG